MPSGTGRSPHWVPTDHLIWYWLLHWVQIDNLTEYWQIIIIIELLWHFQLLKVLYNYIVHEIVEHIKIFCSVNYIIWLAVWCVCLCVCVCMYVCVCVCVCMCVWCRLYLLVYCSWMSLLLLLYCPNLFSSSLYSMHIWYILEVRA